MFEVSDVRGPTSNIRPLIMSETSRGTLKLIKGGASSVIAAKDILDYYKTKSQIQNSCPDGGCEHD